MTASSPKPDRDSVYVHGTHEAEQTRLAALNDLINRRTIDEMQIRPGQRCLDVGCGLGQLAVAMGEATGVRGYVLGVERSEDQLAKARDAALGMAQIEFRRGDALHLPLRPDERAGFDIAVTRFLLEHVPDPLAVVRHMLISVKPGGRIILADDDHDVLRLHPQPPGVMNVWRAYIRLYDRFGNDPFVGRRLVQLLHQAGAKPKRNAWVWFGGCSNDESFVPLVHNIMGILKGCKDQLLLHELITADEFAFAMESLKRFAAREDAAIWFAMSYAEGTRVE